MRGTKARELRRMAREIVQHGHVPKRGAHARGQRRASSWRYMYQALKGRRAFSERRF